jgi:hypothetical protein
MQIRQDSNVSLGEAIRVVVDAVYVDAVYVDAVDVDALEISSATTHEYPTR